MDQGNDNIFWLFQVLATLLHLRPTRLFVNAANWPTLSQKAVLKPPLQQKMFFEESFFTSHAHKLFVQPCHYFYTTYWFRVSAFLFKSVLNCFETFKHPRLTLLEIIHSFTNLPQKWSSVWHWPFLVNGSVKWSLFETMGRWYFFRGWNLHWVISQTTQSLNPRTDHPCAQEFSEKDIQDKIMSCSKKLKRWKYISRY